MASYTYDYADRPASLSVTPAGGSAQTVASAASYLPSGPLTALTLGNTAVETRSFDGRYLPTSIVASGNRLTWNYTTDDVGNPTAITQTQPVAEGRTYGYQDHQYFLTTGNGPWGNLSWAYDRIGNRLTETRDGLSPDVYSYVPNSATPTPGNTALLDQITLGTLGTRDYNFGPAGHLDEIVSGAVTTAYQHSPEGQLTDIGTIGARSTMTYDGRGFLRQAEKPAFSIFEDSFETVDTSCWSETVPGSTESSPAGACFAPGSPIATTATYGSEGLLYSLLRSTGERHHVLYFAGRPVAQLRVPTAGTATFIYLTTDHLGTPILAMNQAGSTLWRGGFEPFGADWNGSATAAGVFLRFPGQWDDGAWAGVGAAELSYNLHRWYERGTGRYERVDPLHSAGKLDFVFVKNRPLSLIDPLGLKECSRCDQCPCGVWLYTNPELELFAFTGGASGGALAFSCACNSTVCTGPVSSVTGLGGASVGGGVVASAVFSVGIAWDACNSSDLEGLGVAVGLSGLGGLGFGFEGGSSPSSGARFADIGAGVGAGAVTRLRFPHVGPLICRRQPVPPQGPFQPAFCETNASDPACYFSN